MPITGDWKKFNANTAAASTALLFFPNSPMDSKCCHNIEDGVHRQVSKAMPSGANVHAIHFQDRIHVLDWTVLAVSECIRICDISARHQMSRRLS
jgi:hypothetical protein